MRQKVRLAAALLICSCAHEPNCVTREGTELFGETPDCPELEVAISAGVRELGPLLPRLSFRIGHLRVAVHPEEFFYVPCSITGRECQVPAATWCPEGKPDEPIIELGRAWRDGLPHELAHAGECPTLNYLHEGWKDIWPAIERARTAE
jgi:hypothetical protein